MLNSHSTRPLFGPAHAQYPNPLFFFPFFKVICGQLFFFSCSQCWPFIDICARSHISPEPFPQNLTRFCEVSNITPKIPLEYTGDIALSQGQLNGTGYITGAYENEEIKSIKGQAHKECFYSTFACNRITNEHSDL